MSDRRLSDDTIRTVLLQDEGDEASCRLPARPMRRSVVGTPGVRQRLGAPGKTVLLQDEGDEAGCRLPARPMRRIVVGTPGVRQRLGAPGRWVVEFRFRASNWTRSTQVWIGSFATEEEAMFAYDAAQYFLGNSTYYVDYPEGFFESCPPRFKNKPMTKGFEAFVKEKANQYAMRYRELKPNVLIFEARTSTNPLVALAGDKEEAGATSDIEVTLVTSAAAGAGRPGGTSALQGTSLSLSADSKLISDGAVEVTQLVCYNPSQTTPHEVNWSDSDGLPPLDGLELYVCSPDEISKMDSILIAGFDLNLDEVPTPEGASGSIVPSLERPFL
ncbi:unnamed protein product [Sphagnum troendelagicum]|uniref:AP2/ERF domain-containing protein n=1 Tax=Sphagnum troendelagicum TaxID=128251 RepID=A0ABP0UM32_9BRYO